MRSLAVLALLLGCKAPAGLGTVAHSGPAWWRQVRRLALPVAPYSGLSDLTVDAGGNVWAVPERQRALLRLNSQSLQAGTAGPQQSTSNPSAALAQVLPLRGVPAGSDTEGITWLAPNTFALATETQRRQRRSDAILWVQVAHGVAQVQASLQLPYSLWNMRARANNGLEGICQAGNDLWVTSETTLFERDNNKRWAPLGRYNLQTQQWRGYLLQLSSRYGKIAALTCRLAAPGQGPRQDAGAGVEALAIERHVGVSRLLHFWLPASHLQHPARQLQRLVVPKVLLNFGNFIDSVPNLEGLAWEPQRGDLWVLSDNDMGLRTGPTQLLQLPYAKIFQP